MRAPTPDNEASRVRALHALRVLDTADEAAFDRVTGLVARLLEVPIALVSLVDEERQWFKSCVGLGTRQTHRDEAFCAHAILAARPLVVPEARDDPRFADNPLVTGAPFIRAYAGVPLITHDGFALGTLCAIDTRPRAFTAAQIATLGDLAAVVVDVLERRVAESKGRLLERIAEVSPNMVYLLDLELGRVTFASDAFNRVFGFDTGKVDRARVRSAISADDLLRFDSMRVGLANAPDGTVSELTYRMRDQHGDQLTMITSEAVFERRPDGRVRTIVGVCSDVTALEEARAELAASQQELRARVRVLEAILETAGEAVIVVDERADYLVFNPAARALLGPPDRVGAVDDRARTYGIYDAQGRPVPRERMPLARGMAGEAVDRDAMLVRNPTVPDGRHVLATARPIRDERGVVRGAVGTFTDVSELEAAKRQLAALAVTDELTGLPNRRALRQRLELLDAEAVRGRRFVVYIVDLDHFKQVNDGHGHEVGDQVLIAVARALTTQIRRIDLVARLGGEEFCVVMADLGPFDVALQGERLRAAVAAITAPVPVTASLGACHSSTATGAEALLRAADAALYQAKRDGRNRVVVALGGDTERDAAHAHDEDLSRP